MQNAEYKVAYLQKQIATCRILGCESLPSDQQWPVIKTKIRKHTCL